jgi:hypothetical protein
MNMDTKRKTLKSEFERVRSGYHGSISSFHLLSALLKRKTSSKEGEILTRTIPPVSDVTPRECYSGDLSPIWEESSPINTSSEPEEPPPNYTATELSGESSLARHVELQDNRICSRRYPFRRLFLIPEESPPLVNFHYNLRRQLSTLNSTSVFRPEQSPLSPEPSFES